MLAQNAGEGQLFPGDPQCSRFWRTRWNMRVEILLMHAEFLDMSCGNEHFVLIDVVDASQLGKQILKVSMAAVGRRGEPEDGNLHSFHPRGSRTSSCAWVEAEALMGNELCMTSWFLSRG